MKKELYMDDAHKIALEAFDLIEKRLKEYEIELPEGEDDKVYVPMATSLENLSNGDYRNMN